ncbi:transcription initiation factor iie subunit alpha [Seiridium cupressi]|uniref:HTH TFE/IIEalpha-type domain-containing protein n=1 Tax=Seiridium unicorne TaxID=138068 RepID=A0ABR2UEH7_9PEZI
MDLAQTLVRSVVRAFYDPREVDTRHIVIVDALITHSALRDDDLSYLMAQNTKDMSKICANLQADRFIHQHVRAELREGQQKATSRRYYYIDYRQAIDAIKWRVYHLDKSVQGNTVPAAEKKEYFCPLCKSDWTAMEVLDNTSEKGFLCHRCGSVLVHDPDRQSGGHEQSTRLNSQLKFITDLLPQLDSVEIPNNTFETALEAARPVVRDATNQVAPSVVVESSDKPTAVRGMADTGPKSIAISITAINGPSEAEKDAEKARKEKIAQQNALPSWHTTSTVTGISYDGTASTKAAGATDEDKKPDANSLDAEEDEKLAEIFEKVRQEQEAEAARRAAAADEDDEEEDEEDEEFEDAIPMVVDTSFAGEKRTIASSGDTSAADTPASEDRPSKKVKVEEPANDGDSDEEDVAFEDV